MDDVRKQRWRELWTSVLMYDRVNEFDSLADDAMEVFRPDGVEYKRELFKNILMTGNGEIMLKCRNRMHQREDFRVLFPERSAVELEQERQRIRALYLSTSTLPVDLHKYILKITGPSPLRDAEVNALLDHLDKTSGKRIRMDHCLRCSRVI